MKKKLKVALWVLAGISLILTGIYFDFYLPHTKKVNHTGTEIKRMGSDSKEAASATAARDVRFIIGIDVDANDSVVFRNEDTGWSWPPYLKFNSGSVDAHAVNIVTTTPQATVLVKYYGWRLGMFSMFPNVLSLKVVDDDYSHFPLFNIFFFTILIGLTGFLYYRFRRWKKRRAQQREQQLTPQPAPPPQTSDS